jgi:hypothetical protein
MNLFETKTAWYVTITYPYSNLKIDNIYQLPIKPENMPHEAPSCSTGSKNDLKMLGNSRNNE